MPRPPDDYPRDSMRVRRYVNGTLIDERTLTRASVDVLSTDDAAWCVQQMEAGNRYRIIIDDPWGDVPSTLTIEGPQ